MGGVQQRVIKDGVNQLVKAEALRVKVPVDHMPQTLLLIVKNIIPTGKNSTNDFPRTNDLKSLLATMSALLATVLEIIVRDL